MNGVNESNAVVDQCIARVEEMLTIAESGSPTQAAWREVAVAIEIIVGEGVSTRDIAKRLDRTPAWVANVRDWRKKGCIKTPFARENRSSGGGADRATARKVLCESPEQVVAEIAEAMRDPKLADKVYDEILGMASATADAEKAAAAKRAADKKKRKAAKYINQSAKFVVLMHTVQRGLNEAVLHAENGVDETDNDLGWYLADKIESDLARLRRAIHHPHVLKDVNAEFSQLLQEEK